MIIQRSHCATKLLKRQFKIALYLYNTHKQAIPFSQTEVLILQQDPVKAYKGFVKFAISKKDAN